MQLSDAVDPLNPLSLWVPAFLLVLIILAAIAFTRTPTR